MDLTAIVELAKSGGGVALAVLVWLELRAFRQELRSGIAALLDAPRRTRRRATRRAGAAEPRRVDA